MQNQRLDWWAARLLAVGEVLTMDPVALVRHPDRGQSVPEGESTAAGPGPEHLRGAAAHPWAVTGTLAHLLRQRYDCEDPHLWC